MAEIADVQNPKEMNNPELSLNPNGVVEIHTTESPSPVTSQIQNDLDNLISTSITQSVEKQKIDFSASKSETDKKEDRKKALLRERKLPTLIIIYIVVLMLLLSIWVIGFLFYQYIWFQRTWAVDAKYGSYMPWVEKQYEWVMKNLQIEQLDKYSPAQVVTTKVKWNDVERIIQDPDISFLTKKKVMQQWVWLLYNDVIKRFDNYEWLKNTQWQQWFFPNDIRAVVNKETFDNSIQKAIVSVESIRFAVALKYFSMIDSFRTQLASYSSKNKEYVKEKLDLFVSRGEKDINHYVSTCYLNWYEIGLWCWTVRDFFNYYKFVDTSLDKDEINLFLITMDLIEAKLENTDFPSLDISVRDINTKNNTISVNVEINTFKEDEIKLTIENWILNPHIFLSTSIVNHLRESRYVLTDSINITQLSIDQKRVRIWWQTVTVNASAFNFALPLQNEVQREIYDFADIFRLDNLE